MLEGPSPTNVESLRERLAREQEEHADRKATHENAKREAQERDREDYEEYVRWAEQTTVVYRLYTEYRPGIPQLVLRYFDGATIYDTIGIWRSLTTITEMSTVIEIIGTRADLQRIADLAGDIKTVNHQSSVLVTWHAVSRLDV